MNQRKKLIVGMSILLAVSAIAFIYTLCSTSHKKAQDVVTCVNEYFPGQGEDVYSAIHNEVAHFIIKERLAVNEWYLVFNEVNNGTVYVKAVCVNNITLDVAYNPITEECDIVEE